MYRHVGRKWRPALFLVVITLLLAGCTIFSLPKVTVHIEPSATTVAANEQITVQASYTVDRNIPVDLFWEAQVGSLSSSQGKMVTWTAPGQAGTYTIAATAQAGISTDTAAVRVTVLGVPDPDPGEGGNGDPDPGEGGNGDPDPGEGGNGDPNPGEGGNGDPDPGEGGNGDPHDGIIMAAITHRTDHGWYENSAGGERMALTGNNIWFGGSRQDYDSHALLRWRDVQIPPGATVTEAYITFWHQPTALPGVNKDPVLLHIKGFKLPSAHPFKHDDLISDESRWPRTNEFVEWSITEVWSTSETAEHRTPDISNIVQEIVNQPDWETGNALGVIFESQPLSNRYNRSMCIKDSQVEGCKDKDTAPILVIHFE